MCQCQKRPLNRTHREVGVRDLLGSADRADKFLLDTPRSRPAR